MFLILPTALALILVLVSLALLLSPVPYLAPLVGPALIALGVLYKHPSWGILGLIVMVPVEGLFPQGSTMTGAKLVGYALIGVVALQLLLRQLPEHRLRSNLWTLLLPFLGCYLLSLLYSQHVSLSMESLRQLSVGLSLFVLTLLLFQELDLSWLARLAVLSVAASGLVALDNIDPATGRSLGLLSDPNYFALLLDFAMPLALLLALQARRAWLRLLWLGVLGILLLGLIKTGSRSGFVIFLLCLAGTLWHCRDYRKYLRARHFGFVLVVLMIGLPLVWQAVPDKYIERVKSLAVLKQGARNAEDGSLGRRSSYLVVGTEVVRKFPLLGSGPGTFPLQYAQSPYAVAYSLSANDPKLFRVAHNTYAGMLSETGLPAGLLFIGSILLGVRNYYVSRTIWLRHGDTRQAQQAAFFGLSFLALALFLMFLSIPNSKLLWIMLAISSGLRQQAERWIPGQERP
jgi:O-antigen ligase